ncbi:glycoside hydrolase family 32 protein [Microbacterium sp.]|uniref:glycoside hydrolase family 32 protein n=1 Tax=Microbacterium sp. TaxID=51671 RepID=UPI003C72C074
MTATPAPSIVPDALVARAAADPHRPAYHFTAPAGWLNDPNGLTQRDGQYHLFYQFNPHSPVHHRIHWGHAVSVDLINWRDLPIALTPGEGPDVDGCWSGVLVYDGDTPTLVYSGRHGDRELPCVATGTPDLVAWTKDAGNPVISAPPAGVELTAFRDHCVWREGEKWRQLVGSGIRGQGGTAFLYESDDLRAWTYVGPLLVGDAGGDREAPDWTGTMWECVDLFRIGADASGSRDVLVFSAWDDGVTHHPLYWSGRYQGDQFAPSGLHRLDLGGRYFYAPQSMRDESGRRIMFGWMQEGRPDADALAAGWSGVMSLPRVVTAEPDGSIRQEPAPEVASLRDEILVSDRIALGPHPVEIARGDQLDLDLRLTIPDGGWIEIALRASGDDARGDDAAERTVLRLRRHGDRADLSLDRSRSSLEPDVDATPRSGAVPIAGDGTIDLRILVDHSALEVFAAGVPLTARVYPTRGDALGIRLSGDGVIAEARVWSMVAITRPTSEPSA